MEKTYEEWHDKFLRSEMLYEEIAVLVKPYVCNHLPKTPDNILQAKNTLLRVLALLRKRDIPPLRMWGFFYLELLERMYFKLVQGDYPTVCDQIDESLGENGTEELYDGLIFLLEKVENADFSDTYVK